MEQSKPSKEELRRRLRAKIHGQKAARSRVAVNPKKETVEDETCGLSPAELAHIDRIIPHRLQGDHRAHVRRTLRTQIARIDSANERQQALRQTEVALAASEAQVSKGGSIQSAMSAALGTTSQPVPPDHPQSANGSDSDDGSDAEPPASPTPEA